MEKSRKIQEATQERAKAQRDNAAFRVAKAAAHHGSDYNATHTAAATTATTVVAAAAAASTMVSTDRRPTSVSQDPEVLSLIADIRREESKKQPPSKIELAKIKQKMYKQNKRRSRGSPYKVMSPTKKIDNEVLSMLSPSVQKNNFQLKTTRTGGSGGSGSGTGRGSRTGSQLPTPHLRAEGTARRSNQVTGRTARTARTGRTANHVSGRATGRTTGRVSGPTTGRNAQPPALAITSLSPTKKRGGAAAVMDLSELTKGLERGDSTYKLAFGEDMMPAIQKELKTVYAINSQFWLPKTEQTVINEMVSRARKIQRQIDGLED